MKYGVCIEMMFTDLPFEDRFQAAADAGVEYVEMWFTEGLSWNRGPEELARLADSAGVTMTTTVIGSPNGAVGGGLTDPRRRDEWLSRAASVMEFNRAAGIGATIVCTGNKIPDLSVEQMNSSVIDGLRATVELAEAADVTLLLEPLNDCYDHPDYFCTNSTHGDELCRAVQSDHMKLLYDCYHMQIMEGDLTESIRICLDVIGHFHCAGVPGRHEPYNGETNYPVLIKAIEKAGYCGTFGLEYRPLEEATASVRKTLAWFRETGR